MLWLSVFFSLFCLYPPLADAGLFNPDHQLETFDLLGVCLEAQLARFGGTNVVRNSEAELQAVCKNPEAYVGCLKQIKANNLGSEENLMLKYFDFDFQTKLYKTFCDKELEDALTINRCFEETAASRQCASDYKENKATDEASTCKKIVTFFKCIGEDRKKCNPKAGDITKKFQNAMLSKKCMSQEAISLGDTLQIDYHAHNEGKGANGNMVYISVLLLGLKTLVF